GVVGRGNGSGESGSVAAPPSPKLALSSSSENTTHEGSSSGPLAANSKGSREPTASAPENCGEHKVGPDRRLPNGRWPAGVSGNPKGRIRKNPSNDLERPSEFEQALEQKIKVKQGARQRVITKGTALREQTFNQAITGDHRARRDLMAYADKRGIDLFAGHHKATQQGVAEAASLALSDAVLERLS